MSRDYTSVVATRPGGPDVLEEVRYPLRDPRPGEVRIRVEACTVSAVDVQARRGLSTYPPRFPFVPGYAVVGVVDSAGPGVTAVSVGDRVVAMTEKGGYAEYVFIRRYPMMRVSAGLEAADVVAVALNYVVAHQVLMRSARIRRGGSILVTGAAGGIGTALIQLGHLIDLRMYGVDTAAKHPWLAANGAIPLDTASPGALAAVLRREPAGLDAVVDGVGGEWADHGPEVLRRGGVLVEYANPGSPAATLRLLGRAVRGTLIPGSPRIRLYGTSSWRLNRRPLLDAWATLYDLLGERRIAPVIAGRLPLADARRAHELLEDGGVVGSLVLVVRPPPR
ncbi:alcohol dehydrogenase catalytic domain-containing protein [Arthrobacter pityocampae]|uniref:alcohol dehydrogenase catalytic domain-containing protein n=1 Tax=Arthrobacter pityocampae TaxID=547334 RepID=UPI00373563E6